MLLKRHVNRNVLAQLCRCNQRRSDYRQISTESSSKLVSLTNRSIIQVTGRDSAKLLQGLITNDLNLLANEESSIYSMLLNTNGRIVYDLMLYRGSKENEYLIECDNSEDECIIQLMKKYKLRSKVYFEKRPELNLFCIFNGIGIMDEDKILSSGSCYKDTRLAQCGIRVLTESSESSFIESLKLDSIKTSNLREYKEHRYKIGISEGTDEVSNGIPLEHNLAWLNGVSFTKGCYIGQELVARTHHVGVIRKRIMPLEFCSEISENICGKNVINEKGKNVGKIMGYCGRLGVGLMRLREVINKDVQLHVNGTDIGVNSVRPHWWPVLDVLMM